MKQIFSLLFFFGCIFFMANSFGAPNTPTVSVSTEGLAVTVSWTASPDADGYTLFYAPNPYPGEDSIESIEVGNQLSLTAALWNGASFFVAIKAYDDSGLSPYSNIVSFTTSSIADIFNDWLMNANNLRSSFIFETSAKNMGALVNVESVTSSADTITVTASGIPDYQVTADQALLDRLNEQPSGDFINGPNVSIGDVIQFGQDIGYESSPQGQNCTSTGGEGYWPPAPDCPIDDNKSKIFTTAPSPANGNCATSLGDIGYWVNGVSVYNWSDGQVDNNIWQRNATVFEEFDVDVCSGHAANGDYHHHSGSQCLAEIVGDEGNTHSPAYGFAEDGYPIHGPWYADNVLVVSSWVIRDYNNEQVGCSDGQRSCIMADEFDPSKGTIPASTPGYDLGIEVEVQPPFRDGTIIVDAGAYYEDMYWDSSLAGQGGKYLDAHNGHNHDGFGYHYHTTMTQQGDGSLTPAFPYIIGPYFYGSTSTCN